MEGRWARWAELVEAYFSALDTLVKVLFSWVPSPWTTAIIATEIPAAIKPYSIAVAPRSLLINFQIKLRTTVSFPYGVSAPCQ